MSNGDEPVIPQSSYITGRQRTWRGLTKREYLAGMAMQGLLANPDIVPAAVEDLARRSVRQADALLAELARGELRRDPCDCDACDEILRLRGLLEEASECLHDDPDDRGDLHDLCRRIRQALHREEDS